MQRELLPGTEVQARGLLWEVVSVDPAGDQRLYLLRCLQEIRYRNELGSNPFDHEALGLVSVDFAKQEKVLQDLERTQYDVVVVDEAHHCFRLGKAGHRQDTQRRLAEVLARQADHLLLLTGHPPRRLRRPLRVPGRAPGPLPGGRPGIPPW